MTMIIKCQRSTCEKCIENTVTIYIFSGHLGHGTGSCQMKSLTSKADNRKKKKEECAFS